jgi:hypothetical protein
MLRDKSRVAGHTQIYLMPVIFVWRPLKVWCSEWVEANSLFKKGGAKIGKIKSGTR